MTVLRDDHRQSPHMSVIKQFRQMTSKPVRKRKVMEIYFHVRPWRNLLCDFQEVRFRIMTKRRSSPIAHANTVHTQSIHNLRNTTHHRQAFCPNKNERKKRWKNLLQCPGLMELSRGLHFTFSRCPCSGLIYGLFKEIFFTDVSRIRN